MSYTTYQPSGIVPPRAYLLAAVAIAITLPLAVLYAWLIVPAPAVVNIILAFVFALTMASLVKSACARGQVRSPGWAGKFGLLLGVCGWVVQWAAWAAWQQDANLGLSEIVPRALGLAAQPGALLASVGDAWSAMSSTFIGVPVKYPMALAWMLELWALLFFPHYAGKMRAEELFDEAGAQWAHYETLPERFTLPSQADLLALLASPGRRLEDLLAPEFDPSPAKHAILRVYRVGEGDPLVSIVSVEQREKGDPRVVECSPGLFLYVPEAELEALRAGAEDTAVEPDPPELLKAIAHLQAGRLEAAIEAAAPFTTAEEARLYADANRICALACSQTEQWARANGYWQALFERETTAHNALQVATTAIMADQMEEGRAWAERALAMNAISHEMPGVSIITNLMSALIAVNRHAAAMPYLEQLKALYMELHITDSTYLYGHRVPFFSVFLEKSADILDHVLDADAQRQWYAAMLPHLDAQGQTNLSAWMERVPAPAQAS